MLTVCYINSQPGRGYHYSDTNRRRQKKDWSKRPHKTSPFFKGDFSKKYGILTKKKLVLVSGTNVWKFEMMFL